MTLVRCDCPLTGPGAAFQDEHYARRNKDGKVVSRGWRVANATAGKPPKYRCTCCGKEHDGNRTR